MVYVLLAGRSVIAPRGGALSSLDEVALGSALLKALFRQAGISMQDVDGLLVGNALAAGGNPARRLSLALGLGSSVMSLSVDSQCCSGLDAIGLAMALIKSGSHDLVIAGGSESASRAPLRQWPTRHEKPGWAQAPFTPWPDDDPDMVESALALARHRDVAAESQFEWAVRSHRLARENYDPSLQAVEGLPVAADTHTREVTTDLCQRAQRVKPHNPTTMAPIADGAAFLVLASERFMGTKLTNQRPDRRQTLQQPYVQLIEHKAIGSDHRLPGLACGLLKPWLDTQIKAQSGGQGQLHVELMESFAAQTLANMQDLGLNQANVNAWGGLLALGHPIGASGAVLAARLCHRLQPGDFGFAAIPAAGGVASGLFACRPTLEMYR